VLSHLSVQGASSDAESLCSLVSVALGLLEDLEDKVSLAVLKGGGICLGPAKGVFDVLGEITCFDHLPFCQNHRMLYDIPELPDITRPVIVKKDLMTSSEKPLTALLLAAAWSSRKCLQAEGYREAGREEGHH